MPEEAPATRASRPFNMDILRSWFGCLLRHSIVSMSRLTGNVVAFEEYRLRGQGEALSGRALGAIRYVRNVYCRVT